MQHLHHQAHSWLPTGVKAQRVEEVALWGGGGGGILARGLPWKNERKKPAVAPAVRFVCVCVLFFFFPIWAKLPGVATAKRAPRVELFFFILQAL